MSSIDSDYARRLEMRQMSNRDLFKRCDTELVLRLHNKKTHKASIARDKLLVELDVKTGMRRAEMANLEAKGCTC